MQAEILDEVKEAIIHIGVHKTGTTSIQNWMWGNSDHVRATYGWTYPREFSFQSAHHIIPWSVMPLFEANPISRPHRADIKALKYRVQAHDRIILSSESFCMANDSEVEIIRDIFEGFDVTIVIYVRRQDKLIQSEYVQRVKQEVFPLDEPFSNFSAMWRAWVPAMDFYGLYKRWEQRFGNVIIKDFDVAVRGGLVRSFLEVFGAADSAPKKEMPENTSLNYHYVAALRELNILEKFKPGTRNALIEKLDALTFPDGRLSFFRGTGAQKYMEQFFTDNERLAQDSRANFSGFDSAYPYVMPHDYVDTDTCQYLDWYQRILG